MKYQIEDLVDQIFLTFLKEQLYRVINTVGKYYKLMVTKSYFPFQFDFSLF